MSVTSCEVNNVYVIAGSDDSETSRQSFEVDIPASSGHLTKMVNGVMRVFKDQAALDIGQPMTYPYPDLNQFLNDQTFLFSLIASGPL